MNKKIMAACVLAALYAGLGVAASNRSDYGDGPGTGTLAPTKPPVKKVGASGNYRQSQFPDYGVRIGNAGSMGGLSELVEANTAISTTLNYIIPPPPPPSYGGGGGGGGGYSSDGSTGGQGWTSADGSPVSSGDGSQVGSCCGGDSGGDSGGGD